MPNKAVAIAVTPEKNSIWFMGTPFENGSLGNDYFKSDGVPTPLTSSKRAAYIVLNAEKSAGGFDIPCSKGAEKPRRYSFRKRLFYVTTSGIAPLAGRVGEPKGSPVPLLRYINPIRSATSFDIGMAVHKPLQRSSAMSNPASGTSVPSVFSFESKQLRIIVIDDQPWFVAADVCKILELGNPTKAVAALDEDERTLTLIQGVDCKARQTNIINESGLYTLILRCRDAVKAGSLPHRFRKKVTAEVLPAIRKTGRYEALPLSPSQQKVIRTRHSAARIDIELHPDSSGDIHYIGLTPSNAAEMLRVAVHALARVASVNCGEDIA
jgi:prophage antirepressor-like protein